MQVDTHAGQDPGVAKIRALLVAARPVLAADGRAIDLTPKKPPAPLFSDPRPSIAKMREHVQKLRVAVLAERVGPSGASARDLTALTLLETDQSLDKLSQSFGASTPGSANELREESINLVKQAKATSVKAGQALGIPWPL